MPLTFRIESLTYNDDSRVYLGQDAVLVLVGPNNAGKSATLREIKEQCGTAGHSVVLKDVDLHKEGTGEEFIAWLEPHRVPPGVLSHAGRIMKFGTGGWPDEDIRGWWPNNIQHLVPWLVHHATTDSRLGVANHTAMHSRLEQPPSNPLQLLYEDYEAEKRLAEAFEAAFRQPIFLDRMSGSSVGLRVGAKPRPTDFEAEFSRQYLSELSARPLLDSQGDGMRSFTGALLHGTVADWFVVLIDEPEAFLHPPQANLLGRMLVETKPHGRQLILATHSSDIVRGVLDAKGSSVTLVRLDRRGNINHAKELTPSDVTSLWSDPLLRFSNVLDGLFHELVVVCEADADCRFFSAVHEATGDRRMDTLFVPSFGKHRLHVVCNSLRSVGVTTRAVADFDVLREEETCKRLFESLGGVWDEVRREWKIVERAISTKAPPLALNQVREQLVHALDSAGGAVLTRDLADKIRQSVKAVDGWDAVKQVGVVGIPPGEPTQAAEVLMQRLRDRGLFVIPVGEIESFARSVGRHGPAFVSEVLQKDLAGDPELADARTFVNDLLTV